jgi:hypothetical protein
MRGIQMRLMCLCGAILIAACGSRQSTNTTSVSSGGADVAEPAVAEVPPAEDPEASIQDYEEEVIVSDETDAPGEEPPRRDAKMLSYAEAMLLPMEIGDASTDGGEVQLSAEGVARLIDEHLDEMYDACIEKELRRGNELDTVTIDLAIRGKDGMILGATIDPGRRRFKSCLENYLEDVWFPKFASPRMAVRYRFHVG